VNTSIAHFVHEHLILHQEAIASEFQVARLLHDSAEDAAREVFRALLQELLDLYVTQLLHRPKWKRRRRWDQATVACWCGRCGSQMRRHFVRNGHYRRGMATNWGHVRGIKIPLLRCTHCRKGYVHVAFPFLPKYLRIWSDLMRQALLDCATGLSFRQQLERQMEQKQVVLGLHSLNQRVNRVVTGLTIWAQRPLSEVPPIVQLDGIYFSVMERTRQPKRDARRRKRKRLRYRKRVALVALGLWPDGRHQLLGWTLARSEQAEEWQQLLLALHARGLTAEAGFRLAIGDGAPGIYEALVFVYHDQVPFQRCIFHKLQRVGHRDNLVDADNRARILHDAAAIWEIPDRQIIYERLRAFRCQWEDREPRSVHSLLLGFAHSLTYLDIAGLDPLQFARTTSHAERLMRELRRKLSQVGPLLTDVGAQATLTLLAARLNGHWSGDPWLEPLMQAILEDA